MMCCDGLGLTPEEQMALVPGASFGAGASSGSGFWDFLAKQIGGWSTTGQQILQQRNIARGVYTKTTPSGQVVYVQPEGTGQNIFQAVEGGVQAQGSSGMGLILVGGAALLLVFMLAKR